MAETVKKTKAPAKPRATAAKNKKAAEEVKAVVHSVEPSREEISALARKYWAERGWQDGYAEQDWLRAEQELRRA